MGIRKMECSYCNTHINRKIYKSQSNIKNFFCNNECKSKWQILQRENLGFNKEWLVNQYIILGKSSNQIAREIKRDPKRVWEWIKNYGLETRPRGTDYGQCFQPGCGSLFTGRKHSEETKQKIRQKRLQDGHVPYLKNGIHWLKHDGAVSPAWKGGVSPERQAVYSSEDWCNAVKKVWERDKARCQRCHKNHNDELNRGNFHIHHIISFSVKEFRCEITNLILLCKECHRWIHSKNNVNKDFIKEL